VYIYTGVVRDYDTQTLWTGAGRHTGIISPDERNEYMCSMLASTSSAVSYKNIIIPNTLNIMEGVSPHSDHIRFVVQEQT